MKDVFPTIWMSLLSAMVIPNILEYIWISLKLSTLLQLYSQPLNYPILTYIVIPICRSGFKDLDFLILNGSAISKILTIIMFVDKIDNTIAIAKYLRLRLLERIKREKRSNPIIHTFTANFTTILGIIFLVNLFSDKIWIEICTEYTGMDINLLDNFCVIELKVSNYIMLSELFSNWGRGKRQILYKNCYCFCQKVADLTWQYTHLRKKQI